jgi:hypothetical protein
MNYRILPLFAACTLACILLLGNKNGRASSQGKGNTGAPGDETNANGTAKTCVSCHNTGPITATVGITLLELDGDTATSYVPNQDYIARVKINGVGTTVQGYGFQMIGLRNSNNTDLDGFSDFGTNLANNYKIATISGGRTYAEHDNISNVDTFNVRWKAPAAGTGPVTLYASGNAVNRNGGTGGDGAGIATLVLTETTSSTDAPATVGFGVRTWPNPARSWGRLELAVQDAGAYQISVSDAAGQVFWSKNQNLAQQTHVFELPVAAWPAGHYAVTVRRGAEEVAVRLLKI